MCICVSFVSMGIGCVCGLRLQIYELKVCCCVSHPIQTMDHSVGRSCWWSCGCYAMQVRDYVLECLLQQRLLRCLWRLWSVQLHLDCVHYKCIAFPSGIASLGLPSTGGSYTAELHVISTMHSDIDRGLQGTELWRTRASTTLESVRDL